MKVMLDTNVILDVWLAREPFWPDSVQLLARVEGGEIEGWLCPTTVTTLHYLAKKVLGETKARLRIEELLTLCHVGHMSANTFTSALASDLNDFEDAVIEAVSVEAHLDYIATRNLKDFAQSRVPAKEPAHI
jgi:predicted nucleic acid-binding protein